MLFSGAKGEDPKKIVKEMQERAGLSLRVTVILLDATVFRYAEPKDLEVRPVSTTVSLRGSAGNPSTNLMWSAESCPNT